jgi:hypothetical protein
MKVFTFVAPTQVADFDSDIKPFFEYLTRQHGFPDDEQHLLSAFRSILEMMPAEQKLTIW